MKTFAFLILLSFCNGLHAQHAGIATDVSILRSFTKGSRFWAFGQTVQAQYAMAPKTALYAAINYYTAGRFKNSTTVTPKDSLAVPQQQAYTVRSSLRFRQFSLGIRHYFKGSYAHEQDWNLYGIAGFGLLGAKASNSYDKVIDTARYYLPQQALAGSKTVVRLTADIGLGAETLLGGGIYLYGDMRTWLQASSTRSPYLFNNDVPRVLLINAGIRILFD